MDLVCFLLHHFYFRRLKDNKQLLRGKPFANFWYVLKHEKDGTGDRRSYMIYKYEEMN